MHLQDKTTVSKAAFLIVFYLLGTVHTASATMIISNVVAAQRDDGSGAVDIYYDLEGGIGEIVAYVTISRDGGKTWDITPQAQYLEGDVGVVSNGTEKHIVWNGLEDQPDMCWHDARFRITALDESPSNELTVMLPGNVPLKLVRIAAGNYMMGRYADEQDSESNEDPQHGVSLAQDFWMGKYEITQSQWLAVMGSWPGTAPSAEYGLGDNYPAYNVSWDDVQNFVSTLNTHLLSTNQGFISVSLPSEAEWEYACRAGTTTRFYFGDSLDCAGDCSDCPAGVLPGNRTDYMWYCGNNELAGSKPVGEKLPNPFGLYDMSGNVYEWCEDDWHSSYLESPADGSAWIDSPRATNRVMRGGRWFRDASLCRSAERDYDASSNRVNYIGFRLAASDVKEVTVMLAGDVLLDLVYIPAGTFAMGRYPEEEGGYSNEDPQHTVTLEQGFWMGKYEITQKQWLAVMGSWPSIEPSLGYGMGDSYPAYFISWDDAKQFITLLNAYIADTQQGPAMMRLPSESEWEYACRAGTSTRYFFGDSSECGSQCEDCNTDVLPGIRTDYMWYCANNTLVGTKPVGSKLPNQFGLYDMSGNVYEWCEDDWHANYMGAPSDGSAWQDSPRGAYRILRGGSWNYHARMCRSAFRMYYYPYNRNYFYGFRVVR